MARTLLYFVTITTVGCSAAGPEAMSDSELQALVQSQRVNQQRYAWFGENSFSIAAEGSGGGGRGAMDWEGGAVAPVKVALVDRFSRSAEALLPLIESDDVEVIMTGLWAADFASHAPDPPDFGRFVELVRQRLLSHRDARVRTAALQFLGKRNLLTPAELDRLLDDAHSGVYRAALWQTPQLRLLDGPDREALVGAYLKHLNHVHPVVRQWTAHELGGLLGVRLEAYASREGRPADAEGAPRRIDWIRADWWTREETKNQWRAWWETHRLAARPPASENIEPAPGR